VNLPPFTPSASGERRRRPDRRGLRTPFHAPVTSLGRRIGFRRSGEGAEAYIDRPSRGAIAWALAILVLSACDAALTILHVRSGGKELVPTMRLALEHGETTFVAIKMAITAVGVMFLALHERFTIAKVGFRLLLGIYGTLMAYHLLLIALR
jgi:hypothetical protein